MNGLVGTLMIEEMAAVIRRNYAASGAGFPVLPSTCPWDRSSFIQNHPPALELATIPGPQNIINATLT